MTPIFLMAAAALLAAGDGEGPPPEPTVRWERVLGTDTWEGATGVVATADGGVAVAGKSRERRWQGRLLRLDAQGEVLWERAYGGDGWDEFHGIAAAAEGGFALTGWTPARARRDRDFWLVRVDARGEVRWDRAFGSEARDEAEAVATVGDSFVIAGATWRRERGHGRSDGLVVRVDATGALVWERLLGGAGEDETVAALGVDDGAVVVAGVTASKGHGEDDLWVAKLSAAGDVVWDVAVGGAGDEAAHALAPAPDGGVLVAGTQRGTDGTKDLLLVRLNEDGRVQWQRHLGERGRDDLPAAVVPTPGGGYAVCGWVERLGATPGDLFLLGLRADGDVVWRTKRGGSERDEGRGLVGLPGGDLVVAGHTASRGAGRGDWWILRFGVPPGPSSPGPSRPDRRPEPPEGGAVTR